MPGFPTKPVGTPTNRGKARRYKGRSTGLKTGHYKTYAAAARAIRLARLLAI
jgi:hypothetical protein